MGIVAGYIRHGGGVEPASMAFHGVVEGGEEFPLTRNTSVVLANL